MQIILNKFGTTLISRQAGKEAYAAFTQNLKSLGGTEPVEVDFEGVVTFSPSWGDEFLGALADNYGERLTLVHVGSNPSVLLTIKILEETKKSKFRVLL